MRATYNVFDIMMYIFYLSMFCLNWNVSVIGWNVCCGGETDYRQAITSNIIPELYSLSPDMCSHVYTRHAVVRERLSFRQPWTHSAYIYYSNENIMKIIVENNENYVKSQK